MSVTQYTADLIGEILVIGVVCLGVAVVLTVAADWWDGCAERRDRHRAHMQARRDAAMRRHPCHGPGRRA